MEYQLVLYDDNNQIIAITSPITNVVVNGNSVSWDSGRAEGINTNFIVVPASENVGQVGDTLSQDIIAKDQKSSLLSKEEQLKEQIVALQEAMNFLLGI